MLLVVTAGGGMLLAFIQWVESRVAVKHPTMHRTAPQQRITQPGMSTVMWLRKPDLKQCFAPDKCYIS